MRSLILALSLFALPLQAEKDEKIETFDVSIPFNLTLQLSSDRSTDTKTTYAIQFTGGLGNVTVVIDNRGCSLNEWGAFDCLVAPKKFVKTKLVAEKRSKRNDLLRIKFQDAKELEDFRLIADYRRGKEFRLVQFNKRDEPVKTYPLKANF